MFVLFLLFTFFLSSDLNGGHLNGGCFQFVFWMAVGYFPFYIC